MRRRVPGPSRLSAINAGRGATGHNRPAVKAIAILAWVTAAATLVLLTVGGSVHATGSSLACPDWPLCHGQWMPEMVGGVEYEHTHRLLGTLVGLLTLALGVLTFRERRRDPFLARAGLALIPLVILQGVLGGITVLVRLSLVASELHLLISMIFFSLLVIVAVRAQVLDRGEPIAPEADPVLRSWAAVAVVAVGIQILLGGLVRHSGAAMACGVDPVLCAGALLPDYWLGQIHMLHRVAAVGVSLLVLAAAFRVRRTATRPLAGHLATASAVLVLVQFALGVVSVMTVLDVWAVTAHLTVAALLLIDLVALYLVVRGVRLPEVSSALDREEAVAAA